MTPRFVVIDTNVVVAGLLTGDPDSPTARVLDGMLHGAFRFLLSVDLLAEYRKVLLRPRIAERHGLDEAQVDEVLTRIASLGLLRSPAAPERKGPDPGDDHLWALLDCEQGTVLVTGDKPLLDSPPADASVVSPRDFLDWVDPKPPI